MGSINLQQMFDSLPEGIFAIDAEHRIVFWNAAAERITGWSAHEIIGRCCNEHLLKDRTLLSHCPCGPQCPLKQALDLQQPHKLPLLVYATGRDGRQIPLEIHRHPMHDDQGNIVGGVQMFRELPSALDAFDHAQRVFQQNAANLEWTAGNFTAKMHYFAGEGLSHNLCCSAQLDGARIAMLLADVNGDGVPAALYGLHLRNLWEQSRSLLLQPESFMSTLSRQIHYVGVDHSALAICLLVLVDARQREIVLVGAGQPGPLYYNAGGEMRQLELQGDPLGWKANARYEPLRIEMEPGAVLLGFSDSMAHLYDLTMERVGHEGVRQLVERLGFPATPLRHDPLRAELIRSTGLLTFPLDITLLEVRHRVQP